MWDDYSQLGATRLVGYHPSHIQGALTGIILLLYEGKNTSNTVKRLHVGLLATTLLKQPALCQEKWSWELIEWSPNGKFFDLISK